MKSAWKGINETWSLILWSKIDVAMLCQKLPLVEAVGCTLGFEGLYLHVTNIRPVKKCLLEVMCFLQVMEELADSLLLSFQEFPA